MPKYSTSPKLGAQPFSLGCACVRGAARCHCGNIRSNSVQRRSQQPRKRHTEPRNTCVSAAVWWKQSSLFGATFCAPLEQITVGATAPQKNTYTQKLRLPCCLQSYSNRASETLPNCTDTSIDENTIRRRFSRLDRTITSSNLVQPGALKQPYAYFFFFFSFKAQCAKLAVWQLYNVREKLQRRKAALLPSDSPKRSAAQRSAAPKQMRCQRERRSGGALSQQEPLQSSKVPAAPAPTNTIQTDKYLNTTEHTRHRTTSRQMRKRNLKITW